MIEEYTLFIFGNNLVEIIPEKLLNVNSRVEFYSGHIMAAANDFNILKYAEACSALYICGKYLPS